MKEDNQKVEFEAMFRLGDRVRYTCNHPPFDVGIITKVDTWNGWTGYDIRFDPLPQTRGTASSVQGKDLELIGRPVYMTAERIAQFEHWTDKYVCNISLDLQNLLKQMLSEVIDHE